MKNLALVSGRGYGKTLLAAQIANPEAPTVAELQNAIPLEGVTDVSFSLGPFDAQGKKVPLYRYENYEAQMRFERDYVISQEQMKAMYHSMSFRRGILGEFSLGLEYTPAEELRDRLNDRLQGKDPLSAINTRYWRDQK